MQLNFLCAKFSKVDKINGFQNLIQFKKETSSEGFTLDSVFYF